MVRKKKCFPHTKPQKWSWLRIKLNHKQTTAPRLLLETFENRLEASQLWLVFYKLRFGNGTYKQNKEQYLCSARHDWLSSKQLCQDATSTPKVNTYTIRCSPKKKLRGAIPKGHNSACHGLLLPRIIESCQSKICNFKDSFIVNKQIGTLDITVQYTSTVAMLKTRK